MPNEIPKADSQLDTAIDIPIGDLEDSNLNTGYDESTNKWEVIVKYNGDLQSIADTLDIEIEILLQGYAIITLEADKIRQLAMYPQIEYIEKPKRLQLVLNNSLRKSCITQVQNQPPFYLNGSGVIVGIIDSGIDYNHPDFINSDGTSRILYIWDQSINGNPPEGFSQGYEFTKADIDNALNVSNRQERQQIIPHMDNVGHGTAVAGVAAGNGRAGRGRYTGVAPESSLIIVKLGERGRESFARTTELMRGIKYIVDKAVELNMPLALNISFGTNDGSHDGNSLFESYIDDVSNIWRISIAVAIGNEGAAAHHYRNRVPNGERVDVEFTVAQGLRSLSVTMWKSFADRMSIEIIAPNGVSTGIVPFNILSASYILGNSKVYIVFGQPTPYNGDQEIFFEIIPNNQYLSEGIWIIRVYGDDIVEGTFNIWLPITEISSSKTAFLDPDIYTTLTLPSTASSVISVGGYNSGLDSVTDFSGKGFKRNGLIKPDIVAPAVNITAPSVGGGYDSFTGTSFAAPHVTGSAALLMQWGIVNRYDPFLYGQKLKAYLKLGAMRLDNENFPNREWGFGSLCLKNTLDNLLLMQDNSIAQNVEIQQRNGSIEEMIYSNDYIDLIAEYNNISKNIIDNNEYIRHCRIIDNNYAILYINKNDYNRFISEYSNKVSFQEPFILGLMDYAALDAAGILNVQVQPYLNLRGRGVLVGIIDTGIDYTNDIFKYEDGTSKIVSIWDQTIENRGSGNPGELCYGTEYTNEQINLALRSENPFDIVPTRDVDGHGTFLAGMSAGRESPENNFIGAAPDAELIVVKLKESKPYLKEQKAIFTDVPSYQSNDLMTAVNYVYEKANTLGRPVAILIALGTNEGGHSGQSLLETYLESIALRNAVAICEACGNEGNARSHAYEILAQGETKNLEIRVPEGERGFTVNIYAFITDKIAISITSPLGETIQKIQPVSNYSQEFRLNLSNTSVTVSFFIPARVSNDQRVNLRFVDPSPGIWTVTLIGEQVSLGAVHAWLPIENFTQIDTTFLSPDSYFTTVVPATGRAIISVGGYNYVDDSLFISSSRGPNRIDSLNPVVVAPAVNINGIGINNRPVAMTGTSVAASIVTGAAALLFEWGIVQERTGSMNSLTIMSYLIRGAHMRGEPYPNNLWGFGTIDLYNSFRQLL